MGFLDKLTGRDEPDHPSHETRRGAGSEDERALERYRYLVRTAPPERIEQAHEEAFAALTPVERRRALEQLSRELPQHEAPRGDDPRSLARTATRAELRRPGTVERAFGGAGAGFAGMGMGVPLLASFATAFAGTLAAQALFADLADGELVDGFEGDVGGAGADAGEAGDGYGGGDLGGDGYDSGDFGGGDFGGGDAGF